MILVFCLWLANKAWEKFFCASITPGFTSFYTLFLTWSDPLLYQWLLTKERKKALSFSEVAAYLDRNRGQSAVHVTATVLTVTTKKEFHLASEPEGITTKKESKRRAARQKKIRSLTDYLNSLPDRAH